MSRVLTGRVKRVGNSLAVIIPKEFIDESGASEGDTISLSIAIAATKRDSALGAIAGLDQGKKAFRREKTDKY